LQKSRSYTSEKLSITLWSAGKDEGAEFVLREGVGDLYHLKEQGRRANAGLALDLCSNLGAVTIQLSRLHPQWTIVAMEAMPITFLYQVVNLWLNVRHEMQRGVIVPTLHALSSVDGATVTMQSLHYSPPVADDVFAAPSSTTERAYCAGSCAGSTLCEPGLVDADAR
jgi:hypothetical protein